MKILVTGDRQWTSKSVMLAVLETYPCDTTVIHGYCRGADIMADELAASLGMSTIKCPAHWRHNTPDHVKIYGPCSESCDLRQGRVAGILRNALMLYKHSPERVLAFHNDLSQSKGTLDMVKRSLEAGLDVELYDQEGFVGKNPPTTPGALNKFLNLAIKRRLYL